MFQKYVMANWKMNLSLAEIENYLDIFLQSFPIKSNVQCIIFPPSIYIPEVAKKIKNTAISLGAQNIYPEKNGAFTGEISVKMLNDYQCKYVLVGHSERRTLLKEDENFIAKK